MGSKGLSGFAQGLSKSKSLQNLTLILRNNQIEDEGILALGQSFADNLTLKSFKIALGSNKIGIYDDTCLAALVISKNLINLSIDFGINLIDNRYLQQFSSKLKNCLNLISLELLFSSKFYCFGVKEAQNLCYSIIQMKKLQRLTINLSVLHIENKDLMSLLPILANCSNLVLFNIQILQLNFSNSKQICIKFNNKKQLDSIRKRYSIFGALDKLIEKSNSFLAKYKELKLMTLSNCEPPPTIIE
ncbi:hypothetical protein TTHERM_01232200 (macronuclear) [Tetrahymena thermophila SB210]|uniref:Kinase domain protein n=1 Tax=Tetrahymena thermophila (strain SB210) TaxID=312017 RepID=Q24DG7_TETTS|nr:hypothetical protein TTHERM_01232200 [Tetrahymena thermophila SB210]EAS05811.2 hypothetical protein TTHERM_01232200 [Tetrahymena thermophila SB210]|eukprot:XP_001026056.2 hypothetical protein TTHERM_01232200 [Tetrahymena thermophila SB210]